MSTGAEPGKASGIGKTSETSRSDTRNSLVIQRVLSLSIPENIARIDAELEAQSSNITAAGLLLLPFQVGLSV